MVKYFLKSGSIEPQWYKLDGIFLVGRGLIVNIVLYQSKFRLQN